MSNFDRNAPVWGAGRAQQTSAVEMDQGLRSFMLGVYNNMSIGLAITVWLASSLFVAVIDAMNRIYGIKERRHFIKLRLIAIVMTLIQALILVGSLVVIVAGPMFLKWLGLSEIQANIATVIQYLVIELMVLISFALAFYVAPDSDQSWEWITPGSILGSLAFIGVTLLFRLYVQHFADYDKAYGPLGGVMVRHGPPRRQPTGSICPPCRHGRSS